MTRPPSSLQPPSPTPESPFNRFYQAVWRWHFYAGLFVIPVMFLLAITGSIYLFKPQLDQLMYPHLMRVQPSATSLSYTQQVAQVQQAYPEVTVTKVTPPITTSRSTEIQITTADQHNLMVFLNPYTGQVLGQRDEDTNFQAIVRKIHGELLIGKWGDYLVELASCWALVLLISGLYLWWPQHRFNIFGTLIPRFWSQNKRIFWRDLHAVPGFYGLLLIGFLILTGLPWSGFWGETFANVWGRFPAQLWQDIPPSTVLTGTLNQLGTQGVPWAVEKLPMPRSVVLVHNHTDHDSVKSQATFNLDAVVKLAHDKGVAPGFNISLPKGKTGVYTVSSLPNDPTQEITLHIDQYSGQVLADVRWQDYGPVPKAVEMGIALHMGRYFGLANQLLMLLACLIVMLLCVTGVVLWWQRRPASRLGAPPRPLSNWQVPLAIVAILGLAFPLVGGSLVIVLLFDYFVVSRIPKLRQILN